LPCDVETFRRKFVFELWINNEPLDDCHLNPRATLAVHFVQHGEDVARFWCTGGVGLSEQAAHDPKESEPTKWAQLEKLEVNCEDDKGSFICFGMNQRAIKTLIYGSIAINL
jgi:hypothetical protein